MRRAMLLLTSVCLMIGVDVSGSEELTLKITPRVTHRHGAVILRISVEPNEYNRALIIEADSDDYYRRSDVTLEGARAARTHQMTIEDLPGGEYTVRVRVFDSERARAEVRRTLIVLDAASGHDR